MDRGHDGSGAESKTLTMGSSCFHAYIFRLLLSQALDADPTRGHAHALGRSTGLQCRIRQSDSIHSHRPRASKVLVYRNFTPRVRAKRTFDYGELERTPGNSIIGEVVVECSSTERRTRSGQSRRSFVLWTWMRSNSRKAATSWPPSTLVLAEEDARRRYRNGHLRTPGLTISVGLALRWII